MFDDDLFDGPAVAVAPSTARITCRVCERPAETAIDAPARLCQLCAEDLEKTAAHIAGRLQAAMWAAQDAWERLDADVGHADDATLARWHAFQDAITAGDPRADETERRAAAVKGDFAALVRRWVAWKTALDAMSRIERWAALARAEVEAARDA